MMVVLMALLTKISWGWIRFIRNRSVVYVMAKESNVQE
mgnify:CR=1 FL=1